MTTRSELAPQLLAHKRAREHIVDRLVGYCMALPEQEKKRRAALRRRTARRA